MAWVLCALSALSACQTYERRPLDLNTARDAWLSRSPSDPTVRQFAATLDLAAGDPLANTFDPSDGLTLAEAEVVLLVFNPDLRQSRLQADVTRAIASHAGLWQDPVLGVDLERVVSNAGGANPWVAASTLSLTIPISGRLEAEKARAGADLIAALDRLAAQEWAARSALQELWVEWSSSRTRLDLTQQLVAHLRDVVALADQQADAGSMTRIDARVFRVELAGREADLIAITARAQELELQLKAMLGMPPHGDITLVPTLAIAPRTTDTLELHSLLEASNPELAAIRAEYEVAEQSLRTEVRKQYPDLTLGPGYSSDQGDNRVLLGLSLPIPLWNRNQQGVAQAAASREVARGRFETTYEHLSMQLELALIRLESGRSQRALIESSVVPLADAQEADVARVAALGRVDPLMLLESLKTQYAVKLRLIDARSAESLGAVRLNELIGPVRRVPTPAATAMPDAATPAPAASHLHAHSPSP